jgi:hypothetical protein
MQTIQANRANRKPKRVGFSDVGNRGSYTPGGDSFQNYSQKDQNIMFNQAGGKDKFIQQAGNIEQKYQRPADYQRFLNKAKQYQEGQSAGGKILKGLDGIMRLQMSGADVPMKDAQGRTILSMMRPELTAQAPTLGQLVGDMARGTGSMLGGVAEAAMSGKLGFTGAVKDIWDSVRSNFSGESQGIETIPRPDPFSSGADAVGGAYVSAPLNNQKIGTQVMNSIIPQANAPEGVIPSNLAGGGEKEFYVNPLDQDINAITGAFGASQIDDTPFLARTTNPFGYQDLEEGELGNLLLSRGNLPTSSGRNIGDESDPSIFGIDNAGVSLPYQRSTIENPNLINMPRENVNLPEYYDPNNTLGNIYLESIGVVPEGTINSDLRTEISPEDKRRMLDQYIFDKMIREEINRNKQQKINRDMQMYQTDPTGKPVLMAENTGLPSLMDLYNFSKNPQIKTPIGNLRFDNVFSGKPELGYSNTVNIFGQPVDLNARVGQGGLNFGASMNFKKGGSVDKYAGLGYKLK